MRPSNRFIRVALMIAPALVAGCQEPVVPPAANVVVASAPTLPADPADAAWQAAPEHVAKLIPQDLVEPRLMKASTPEVRVRAITNGAEVAFRLEWADDQSNDLPGPAMFCDACAVQVPAKNEPTLPAPQMGEVGRPVEIAYWSAAWQAVVDGRGDSIKEIYPNATVDHYPFEAAALKKGSPEQREMAARYAPARALGNLLAGPRTTPVQDLVAEGPGTLTPAAESQSQGQGRRAENRWTVVIRRQLPAGFNADSPSNIAFAVWQGATEEVGARKMRTGWIPLTLQTKAHAAP